MFSTKVQTNPISNPLPKRQILDSFECIGPADSTFKSGTKDILKLYDRKENMVGKGENAGYQHFLPFPTMFLKGFFLHAVKISEWLVTS